MSFDPPVTEIKYCLHHIAGLGSAAKEGLFGPDFDRDLADAVLAEAGRFAADVVAPLDRGGDRQGSALSDGAVTMPEGWKEAYRDWMEAGWPALPGPVDYGGQGLPFTLSAAVTELWNEASLSFGLSPLLTQSAAEALNRHGSQDLKDLYLEKLVSGAWAGAMLLTEPQAGSDLSTLSCRATRQDDGSYRLTGTKIFITYGEHDLTENIVHMVLARVDGAPTGTKGISMFLVPKYLVDADGGPGERNDIFCTALEHKLGIHASPTCVMSLGDKEGARGWLVGEENRGLANMFTMMNHSRLTVGLQGVAVAERAMQSAVAYADERRQGRTHKTPPDEFARIIEHPDVLRMILTMQARTAAARAICFKTAEAIDRANTAAEPDERAIAAERASLLTPMAKFYGTEAGVEVSSMALQVHGGAGYIEETGAAQFYRDARILPIYEGTNGIQAIDLVLRKLPLRDWAALQDFVIDLNAIADEAFDHGNADLQVTARRTGEAISDLVDGTERLREKLESNRDIALFAATPYCRLISVVAGGGFLLKGALEGLKAGDPLAEKFVNLAKFYAEQIAPETTSLKLQVARSTAAYILGGVQGNS